MHIAHAKYTIYNETVPELSNQKEQHEYCSTKQQRDEISCNSTSTCLRSYILAVGRKVGESEKESLAPDDSRAA